MPDVWDVRVQPDGRVTARAQFNYELALMVFEHDGDRWLIDLFNDQVDVGERATPAP